MDAERRLFLSAMLPAALAMRPAWQQDNKQSWPPLIDDSRNKPPDDLPKIDPKQMLKHNQKQIQEDVERLYALAEELKKEVGKTDSSNVLSLPLVQKAEAIEKLAKQIKSLARG